MINHCTDFGKERSRKVEDKMFELENERMEAERNYVGQTVELIEKNQGKISGLIKRINLSHGGVKIGNKWYSARRLLPCRGKGEVEVYLDESMEPNPEPCLAIYTQE